MCVEILNRLESLQYQDSNSVFYGNYLSIRYHRYFPISRNEDNIYFVSWVNQLLRRNRDSIDVESRLIVDRIYERGEKAIHQYRNRYGELSYNFYRPNNWFPNGRFLSKFVGFQPTDDSDDTSIAMRGKHHDTVYAKEIKEIYRHQSNGLRGRYIKRGPRQFRRKRFYNTWIGSEELYVDLDLVVLCNILMFNAEYDQGISEEDLASLEVLVESVNSSLHLTKKWSLSAWYPFASVILYCIADLISVEAYIELDGIRDKIIADLYCLEEDSELGPTEKLLVENALMKLGRLPKEKFLVGDIDSFIHEAKGFSFGVIPLLHPWNGRLAQFISSFSLFRMYYRCDAQNLAIVLENKVLKNTLSVEKV